MFDPRKFPKDGTVKNDVLKNVCLFLIHLLQQFQRYLDSGQKVRIDEQNIFFWGNYNKKMHIKKKIGSGFQCGVVFDDEFIFC